jgi:hypothetical protein
MPDRRGDGAVGLLEHRDLVVAERGPRSLPVFLIVGVARR